MWTFIARTILKNRITILCILGAITIFMAFNARNVQMSYEYASLLPESDSTYIQNQEFIQEFGNEGNMMVIGVKDPGFFSLKHFKAWRNLSAEIDSLDGILAVFSTSKAYDLKKNTKEKKFEAVRIFSDTITSQETLDIQKEQFENLEFYKNMLYNAETRTYLMAVTLKPEIMRSPERTELVRKIEEFGENYKTQTGLQLHYSGMPYIRITTAEMVKKELNMFIYFALAITALIIFIFFRSFKVVMYSMLVVGVAVVWALGIQALFGFKITILTGMIPPLIIVIGIPNSVFLLNKYHQEFKIHGNKIKALQRIIRKIGNATFLTNLTTASGFATFIFTSSKILVEFGIIAAINIMVVFMLSLLLIPIIFSFASAPKQRHLNHLKSSWTNNLVNKLIHITLNHRKAVYTVTIIMLVFGAFGITQIKTTGYMLDDIPHKHTLYKDLKFFESNFGGLMPLEVVIDTQKPKGILKSSTLKKIDTFEQRMHVHEDIAEPLSMIRLIKFARQSFYNGNSKYFDIPSTQERNFLLSYLKNSGTGGAELNSTFNDSLSQKTRISFRIKDVGTNEMVKLESYTYQQLNDIFPQDKFGSIVTGATVVFSKGTKYLIKNLFTSLLLAILLIASFMAWMFSSKRMVLVSLIPNLIPLIMTAALMGYFGIPIKPSTILVFSIAFGISVDDTIHFLAKYRQELSETNWSIRAAVVLALKETGVSMFYTSIVLFFGFGIFVASSFGGTMALGMLVAITLLIALLSNLILLPSLLLSLERRITNKSFKEPLLQIYDEDEDIELEELQIQTTKSIKEDDKKE